MSPLLALSIAGSAVWLGFAAYLCCLGAAQRRLQKRIKTLETALHDK